MKKLALVLGGGATKGYAHIGVLKVLEQNNIIPDLIVGCSMGAIVGGLYASGKDSDYLLNISKKITKNKLMDFNLINLFVGSNIMSGKKLRKVLFQEIGDITHEQLKIPFISVATDIMEGKLVILKQGKLLDNILASSSIPVVFPSIKIDNQILGDGGILNNVPDAVARKEAKDYIILTIDVVADYKKQIEHSKLKIVASMINLITLMQTEITKLKGDCSDIRINITQSDISQMGFDKDSIESSIDYGMEYMKRHISKLKKLLKD